MLVAGFEPTIADSERSQTHALDRAATKIGHNRIIGSSVHEIEKIKKVSYAAENTILI
jgi:hypothetical protein